MLNKWHVHVIIKCFRLNMSTLVRNPVNVCPIVSISFVLFPRHLLVTWRRLFPLSWAKFLIWPIQIFIFYKSTRPHLRPSENWWIMYAHPRCVTFWMLFWRFITKFTQLRNVPCPTNWSLSNVSPVAHPVLSDSRETHTWETVWFVPKKRISYWNWIVATASANRVYDGGLRKKTRVRCVANPLNRALVADNGKPHSAGHPPSISISRTIWFRLGISRSSLWALMKCISPVFCTTGNKIHLRYGICPMFNEKW